MPIDDYQKVREIAVGSFGRTFLVRREADKKMLAMKEFDIASLSQLARRNALEEVQALCSLKHPFLIRYLEKFVHGRQMCMIADDCDEGTLWGFTKLCSKQRAFIPETQVVRWFCQISLAVKYLHERPRPILHGDVKLQNVFIVKQNSIDVGSAKLFVEIGSMWILETPGSLVQGHFGTHFCLAPELCNRLPYGTAVDVWALGCVLYELCTAHWAWEDDDIPEHIENVMISPFSTISGSYSSELGQVAAALLTHNPSERPSAADVLKTSMLQTEIRNMLADRKHGGGNRVEAKSVDPPKSENEARVNACPPSARNKYMPLSARGRAPSPHVAHAMRVCDDGPPASNPHVRPLGEHNPRMPRTARSPSPHEAAKLMVMAQIPDSPRHRGSSCRPGLRSSQEAYGESERGESQRRMEEAALILHGLLFDPADLD